MVSKSVMPGSVLDAASTGNRCVDRAVPDGDAGVTGRARGPAEEEDCTGACAGSPPPGAKGDPAPGRRRSRACADDCVACPGATAGHAQFGALIFRSLTPWRLI